MKPDKRVQLLVGALLTILLLTAPFGMSQQPSSSNASQDPSGTPSAGSEEQNAGSVTGFGQPQALPAASSQGFLIRALNSANPLDEENGPLLWGWFGIRSVSFVQYYSHVNFSDASIQNNPGLQPQIGDVRSSQFSTSLLIDHTFKASHFSLQYAPSLFLTNGNLYSNALNQTVGLDTTIPLNSRWSLQVTDRFSYYASQRYFSETSLNTNYLTGTSVQQNFINGPGSVLYNSVAVPVSYLWSPRTTISFAPSFEYQYSSGAILSDNASLKGLYEGGRFTITHLLSPTQTIGLNYLGQYASFTSSSPHAGPVSNSFLQDFLLTYSKQIGASWHFSLGLGVSDNTSLGNTDIHGGVLLAANAAITKRFHRMDFTVNYNRGHQFNGFITSASSDRVDVSQKIFWARRFSTTTSVAYFKTANALPPTESGSFATEQLNFDLTRQISLSATGAYTKQTGDGVFVASGIRRFATLGITWRIAPPPRY